jgi:hypothetical protein
MVENVGIGGKVNEVCSGVPGVGSVEGSASVLCVDGHWHCLNFPHIVRDVSISQSVQEIQTNSWEATRKTSIVIFQEFFQEPSITIREDLQKNQAQNKLHIFCRNLEETLSFFDTCPDTNYYFFQENLFFCKNRRSCEKFNINRDKKFISGI